MGTAEASNEENGIDLGGGFRRSSLARLSGRSRLIAPQKRSEGPEHLH